MTNSISLAALCVAMTGTIAMNAPSANAAAERLELPRPSYENTFYLLFRCYDIPRSARSDGSDDDQRKFFQDFMDRLGPQRLYARITLRGPRRDPSIGEEFGFFDEMGANGFHRFWRHWGEYRAICEKDRRYLQWFNTGAIRTSGSTHFGDTFATVSRYSTDVWEITYDRYRGIAERFLSQDPPIDSTNCEGAVAVVGPIEASLLETGMKKGLFCDYSPIAIAEFRDYLTHRGLYGKGGPFAGQGKPGGECFSNDSSPAKSAGDGPTFNETYGADFTTWTLRYWDRDAFPEPLAEDAEGMPAEGEKGHTAGGFDPPREEDTENALWNAWNNDDSETPGFRQLLIANFVAEFQKTLHEAGVPRERIFSGIIAHSDEKWHRKRQFVDADPAWVAKSPYGSPGFTGYGKSACDPELVAKLAGLASDLPHNNWAFVEWHPVPHPPDSFLTSVEEYRERIENVWTHRPHFLEIEGWDGLTFGGSWGYETRGTNFEVALKQWLDAMPDRPYYLDESVEYAPPPVRGVKLDSKRDSKGRGFLRWHEKIWDGMPHTWPEWEEFSHFVVYGIDENGRKSLLTETSGHSVRFPASFCDFQEFEVVAVKKGERPDPGYRLTRKDVGKH